MLTPMLAALIQVVGPWFILAVAFEALAVFVEQWGAARSPDEETRRHGALGLLALVLTIVTPGLLLAHGYVTTREAGEALVALVVGAPVAAVLLGSLLGAIVGAVVPAAAPFMRRIALPFDLLAFVLAGFAALPTIQILLQGGNPIAAP